MTESNTLQAYTCKKCGMQISTGLRLLDKDGALCENCVLDTAHHAPLWPESEMPYVSLSEALAAALDAMTSDRSYRKGLSFDHAKNEIRRMSGTQFDPVAVQAFLEEEATLRRMVELKCAEAPTQTEISPK